MRGLQSVGRVARTEFTGLHDERSKKGREPQKKCGIAKQTAEAGGHRGWRILIHARADFKRRCGRSQYAQSKSCRDFEGSLRYSHAGVAEWQTRRTQNPLVARPCGFDSLLRHQHQHQKMDLS